MTELGRWGAENLDRKMGMEVGEVGACRFFEITKVKGGGQECPPHTRLFSSHRSVRLIQACLIRTGSAAARASADDEGSPKTRTPGWLDRPAEALNIVLLAFVMMQAQRKVPLSFAFGERVRDDTKNRNAGRMGCGS